MTNIRKYSNAAKKLDLAELHRFIEETTNAEQELRFSLNAIQGVTFD
jgi:hypothetical protein